MRSGNVLMYSKFDVEGQSKEKSGLKIPTINYDVQDTSLQRWVCQCDIVTLDMLGDIL